MLRACSWLALARAALPAQATTIAEHLEAGDLGTALAELEAGKPVAHAARLACARQLARLAPPAAALSGAAVRVKALTQALHLLRAEGLPAEREERNLLLAQVGQELAEALRTSELRPRTPAFDLRFRALKACREALRGLERQATKPYTEAGQQLIPLLLALDDFGEAIDVCRETLAGVLNPVERMAVRGALGWALLRHKKSQEAIEFLPDWLAQAPRDPAWVLPVARLLPKVCAQHTLAFVQPVLAREPNAEQRELWTACLAEFYGAITADTAAQPGVRAFLDSHTVRKPLPSLWDDASWRDGYRAWRPENTTPAKAYAGAHALSVVRPASVGWRILPQPPAELLRWHNAAVCMQRGGAGPLLVVYWFAPELSYWYGTTPVQAGVTSKTVHGFQRGGIADLVADIAYGEDASKLGKGVRTAAPLPYPLSVKGTTIRKQWRAGDEIYDETWCSVGPVTVEVLLRIKESELTWLEPEIRWLYRNVRTE